MINKTLDEIIASIDEKDIANAAENWGALIYPKWKMSEAEHDAISRGKGEYPNWVELSLDELTFAADAPEGKTREELVVDLVVTPLKNGYLRRWFAGKHAWVDWDCEPDGLEPGQTQEDYESMIRRITVHYAVGMMSAWLMERLQDEYKQRHLSILLGRRYGRPDDGYAPFWYRAYDRAVRFGTETYVPEAFEPFPPVNRNGKVISFDEAFSINIMPRNP
jgi:hypothetical protein